MPMAVSAAPQVVYVESAPRVVYVEQAPRVVCYSPPILSVGIGYGYGGGYGYGPRYYHSGPIHRHR